MINVLIADDHAVVRRGLKQILEETSDIRVVAEAEDGKDVLNKLRGSDTQVVVLDISMPGRSGLDVLRDLKREHTDTPVLVLSIYPEEQFAVRVLKSGASGYMTKESAPEDLVEAVRRVKDGGLYVSPRLAEKLAGSLNKLSDGPLHERLSDREFQVLQMIASGKTVSVIAEDLTLSVKTVSTYRARVLAKMLMKNNSELTRYAFENGLIS